MYFYLYDISVDFEPRTVEITNDYEVISQITLRQDVENGMQHIVACEDPCYHETLRITFTNTLEEPPTIPRKLVVLTDSRDTELSVKETLPDAVVLKFIYPLDGL